MKRKASSKLQEAWSSFFSSTAVANLDSYRADGWKTIDDMATESNRPISTLRSYLRRCSDFEWKTVMAADSKGVVRRVTIARPKLKG